MPIAINGVPALYGLYAAIYFDSIYGVAGTGYPIGTPEVPVNNITDARIIAVARNTTTIVLVNGVITLDANITGYHFIGNGYSDYGWEFIDNVLELNGFTASNCTFERMNINNTAGGILDECGGFVNCNIINVDTMTDCAYFLNCGGVDATTMTGCADFYDCGYVNVDTMTGCYGFHYCGDVSVTTMTSCFDFYDCGQVDATTMTDCRDFFNCGEANISYDCTDLAMNTRMSFSFGVFIISNLTAACAITIEGDHLRLTIDASCNAGTINVYGDIALVNNAAAGCTVNDYRLSKRVVSSMDFWSLPQEEVAVTAVAGNKALPDVVVAGIPTGATIIRSVALFRFRTVENIFVGANSLSGAQAIQLQDDSPSGYINAINFVASMFTFAAAAREGGLIIEGAIDVKVPVDGIDTYNFQWTAAVAAQNNLQFNDVQVGLRVYFTP